jgi:hypothetical protein
LIHDAANRSGKAGRADTIENYLHDSLLPASVVAGLVQRRRGEALHRLAHGRWRLSKMEAGGTYSAAAIDRDRRIRGAGLGHGHRLGEVWRYRPWPETGHSHHCDDHDGANNQELP